MPVTHTLPSRGGFSVRNCTSRQVGLNTNATSSPPSGSSLMTLIARTKAGALFGAFAGRLTPPHNVVRISESLSGFSSYTAVGFHHLPRTCWCIWQSFTSHVVSVKARTWPMSGVIILIQMIIDQYQSPNPTSQTGHLMSACSQ